MYLYRLASIGGFSAIWPGILLRRLAVANGKYPAPLTPDFLIDLAWNIGRRTNQSSIRERVDFVFARVMSRLSDPQKPVAYNYVVDGLLADHGIAPLPETPEVEAVSAPRSQSKEEGTVKKIIRSITDGTKE